MNILVLGLKKNPQLLRLKEEAEKRGHFLEGCTPSQIISGYRTRSQTFSESVGFLQTPSSSLDPSLPEPSQIP